MYKFLLLLALLVPAWAVPPKRSITNIGSRIIGGAPARAAQFPFAVGIYKTTKDGTFFCSGGLLSSQWVLTAGQCVEEATIFNIHLGSNSLAPNNGIRLTTETWILHPTYDPRTLNHDVGLIKFRLPITFTEYIKAVDIVANNVLPDSARVLTVGWGQTSDTTAGLADSLHYVYLTTLSNSECQITYGSQITAEMVCVDGNFNEGTCQGDSGSPLIQYSASELTYHVGISSFFSAKGCESPDPSGYTRTSVYRDWIRNETQV